MKNSVDKNTIFSAKTIKTHNKTFYLDRVLIMGILNLTPDSFSDGNKYNTIAKQCNHVEKMLSEGADIIDIGAMSTKPGLSAISTEEELKRLIPSLEVLAKEFPNAVFSIDTYRAKVVEESVKYGASIINDISGGTLDPLLFEAVAKSNLPYIMQHIKGTPHNMQTNPFYDNVTNEIFDFFNQKINYLKNIGINQIIIDPGFGFGKTVEHNYQILRELASFKELNLPILIGVSRKSMISKLLDIKTDETLIGTAIINTLGIINGANIIRVHDVKEAVYAIKIAKAFLGEEN